MSRKVKSCIRGALVLGLLLFAWGCIGGIERELIGLWGRRMEGLPLHHAGGGTDVGTVKGEKRPKRGTVKFRAECWDELMRFLINTVAEDEKNEYPNAMDMFTLMVNVERKMSRE